ncbi:hypothetical protein TRFO_23240 [Tritrichomonas foetus]|uniref:Protein kinase domain-containing protein n=1 Tax=Tritrichomonas foetus TaxID=1144522 RepID=A0A1J4K9Z0_9EUKA|nr:hypothetical protein TRFO_23240 [Tritrichomonas foetus]|eukprot:OHT08247.1 hypothetical protein TRFO_23240 [Tritrichomonas foetus]
MELPLNLTYLRDFSSTPHMKSVIVMRQDGMKMLVKIISRNIFSESYRYNDFIAYQRKLIDLHSPFVLECQVEENFNPKYVYLIRPFINGRALSSFRPSELLNLGKNTLFAYWKMAVRTIAHLHQNEIFPSFLKLSNIFITEHTFNTAAFESAKTSPTSSLKSLPALKPQSLNIKSFSPKLNYPGNKLTKRISNSNLSSTSSSSSNDSSNNINIFYHTSHSNIMINSMPNGNRITPNLQNQTPPQSPLQNMRQSSLQNPTLSSNHGSIPNPSQNQSSPVLNNCFDGRNVSSSSDSIQSKPTPTNYNNGYGFVITDLIVPPPNIHLSLTGRDITSIGLLAPEFFNQKPLSKASDVWSLGILLFYMMTNFLPWDTKNKFSMVKDILSCLFDSSKAIPKEISKIIDVTVVVDAAKRIEAKGLLMMKPRKVRASSPSPQYMTANAKTLAVRDLAKVGKNLMHQTEVRRNHRHSNFGTAPFKETFKKSDEEM